jgi:sterol desaturase/sphingolipid hydroxylase (fatty acid hydroxylase superfamily)
MAPHLTEALGRLAAPFAEVVVPMTICATVFAALAWLTKGRRAAVADVRAAVGETRINGVIWAIDIVAVGPILAVGIAAAVGVLASYGLQLNTAGLWAWMGRWPTVVVAVVLGDLFGYWRHRLQHSAWLWPAHAMHHSDTHLTWFTLGRMHPIDRAGSLLDMVLLSALGVPVWALAANGLVRHYYGSFIHADLPWTLGKAGWVLNTPVMHRWHHVRDVEGSGYNFATVFSLWDRAFGTYYQPGPCNVPTGVCDDMGRGVLGQYAYPIKTWWEAIRPGRVRLSS